MILPAMFPPNSKTIEDVRKKPKKSLKLRAEERARMNFEEKVINTAVEQSKIEYPPVVIDIEIESIINDQAQAAPNDRPGHG